MKVTTAERLREITQTIFQAAGVPPDEAEVVADSLVSSNLSGHDSHGVIRITQYVEAIGDGRLRPGAKVELLQETAATALLDGNWGLGQVIGRQAMEMAMRKAKEVGAGWVAVRKCGHLGRLGEYPLLASLRDMVGIAMINNHGGGLVMAVWGGLGKRLSPNPISFAIPTDGDRPVLLDMSTSVVAEGKLRVARNKGEKVPEGWIMDAEGRPTTDPEAFYGSLQGAVLPLGGIAGYKGFGLCLAIDIMAGALSGGGCSQGLKTSGRNTLLAGAIDIAAFRDVKEFKKEVGAVVRYVKSSPRLPGVEEILVAGEPEFREQEKRLREGIPIDDGTWAQIASCAEALGLQEECVSL